MEYSLVPEVASNDSENLHLALSGLKIFMRCHRYSYIPTMMKPTTETCASVERQIEPKGGPVELDYCSQ